MCPVKCRQSHRKVLGNPGKAGWQKGGDRRPQAKFASRGEGGWLSTHCWAPPQTPSQLHLGLQAAGQSEWTLTEWGTVHLHGETEAQGRGSLRVKQPQWLLRTEAGLHGRRCGEEAAWKRRESSRAISSCGSQELEEEKERRGREAPGAPVTGSPLPLRLGMQCPGGSLHPTLRRGGAQPRGLGRHLPSPDDPGRGPSARSQDALTPSARAGATHGRDAKGLGRGLGAEGAGLGAVASCSLTLADRAGQAHTGRAVLLSAGAGVPQRGGNRISWPTSPAVPGRGSPALQCPPGPRLHTRPPGPFKARLVLLGPETKPGLGHNNNPARFTIRVTKDRALFLPLSQTIPRATAGLERALSTPFTGLWPGSSHRATGRRCNPSSKARSPQETGRFREHPGLCQSPGDIRSEGVTSQAPDKPYALPDRGPPPAPTHTGGTVAGVHSPGPQHTSYRTGPRMGNH